MLNVEKYLESGSRVLVLTGEIDASNSVELDAAISEVVQEGAKNILIDCSGLEYISSAGLGVFMSYLDEFEENNVKMVIFGLKDKVFQVFHILGLDQLISIRPTKEQALEG
ncbi:STAS domain-containing protein [Aquiflexum gelatinilyticum]|jgi:anti-sigma B factor antagonist|uniref:Anti-sigma factor antagonist n=1 Tax=Aquiflexum gelatinilyticum TaxID=2961943 RepID=A0A9X2T105_9BACT|nr:STAS domain-containing protein [Aquiflexum gelatinilyticum]MCR9014195.1 STAS domain-containing protein [Aquiflexum gelatinilyticum]MCS4433672.1 STAS domain-containing protein [Aquiflexum gelatinilyticum]